MMAKQGRRSRHGAREADAAEPCTQSLLPVRLADVQQGGEANKEWEAMEWALAVLEGRRR